MQGRLTALLLLLVCAPAMADDKKPLQPTMDDVVLTRSARIGPGTWVVADANGNGVIRITASGVTLDLGKAALVGAQDVDPDALTGVGIHVKDASNVTIRGGSIRGYKIGIRAENAPGLVIENVDCSENFRQRLKSTPEREDPSDWLRPHDNEKGEWEAKYGAGISLTNCKGATVKRCRVNDGQNGLLLTRCVRCTVMENDFSFNSGWGIALYRSRRCTVAGNFCDWCVRGYSHGVYHRGQDSAGILVFEQCRENVFVGNSATHGGDGFFLYAGNETTEKTGVGGSNDNLVFENDFSHAVANGIEATFSENNTFVRNDCSDSDHGVWAGYSRRSLIGGNKIESCKTAGVSIEHGQENRIVANRITSAPAGVHLWWDFDKAFVDGVFGKKGDTSSSSNQIHGNDILSCDVAVRLVQDRSTSIRWNVIHGREILLDLGAKTTPGSVEHNLFSGQRSRTRPRPLLVRNESGAAWAVPAKNERRGYLRGEGGFDPMTMPTALGIVRPPSRLPATPNVSTKRRARLGPDTPRGREQIRIGEWGPVDPRMPHAWPAYQAAAGATAQVHLSGTGAYLASSVRKDVEIDKPQGELPATLTVRLLPLPGGAQRGSIVPFEIKVKTDTGELSANGTLLDVEWDVAFHRWTKDPRENDFAAVTKGEPGKRERIKSLDFPWQNAGPFEKDNDRFATVATTVLQLDAGRYRIRTVSDDGVRVYVGDKRVIDNWTHHAPTEDVCELDLTTGSHAVRVEHFEIDGWAHLSFRIERVGK